MKARRMIWALGSVLTVIALIPVGLHFGAQWVHRARLENMKAEVARDFADGESARFRSLVLRTDDTSEILERLKAVGSYRVPVPLSYRLKDLLAGYEELTWLCGQVNAKNAFGAYVGFRNFYLGPHGASPIFDEDGKSELAAKMCQIESTLVLTVL